MAEAFEIPPMEARRRSKRLRGFPTGRTPQQDEKKRVTSAVKKLAFQAPPRAPLSDATPCTSRYVPVRAWTTEETKALVEFMLFHNLEKWESTKDSKFWTSAATFVHDRAGYSQVRTGSACRTRVVRYLHQLYPTPKDAEKDLLVDKENTPQVPDSTDSVTLDPDGAHVDDLSATLIRDVPISRTSCIDWFHQLSPLDQMELITSLYQHHVSVHHSGLHVPPSFLELSLKAMSQLQKSGRSNILFGLAKGLGLQRDDGSGSLIPTNRMPMGLLEYVINFYQSSKTVVCPSDYRLWLESMYCLFGTKWTKLYHGPMWSSDSTEQGCRHGSSTRDPVKARVNVPGLSSRALQMGIANREFTTGSKIQFSSLDEASNVHPNAVWWIKGDGCDVVEGLGESTKKIWTGDIDVADGELQKSYDAYLQRLEFVGKIGMPPRNHDQN